MTAIVRQLDAQGAGVVDRITPRLGSLACSPDSVRHLVDALHEGKSVTITTDANGKTESTMFDASGTHLGYGEAYVALALAAEELRNAGVSSCATGEQWKAVLLGRSVSATTLAGSTAHSAQLPGILKLRAQGQGWGQIAQTANVQLGQIVGTADAPSATGGLAPTGYASPDMTHPGPIASGTTSSSESSVPDRQKKTPWFGTDKATDSTTGTPSTEDGPESRKESSDKSVPTPNDR